MSRAERRELIAYQQIRHERRLILLDETIKKLPAGFGELAQVLIMMQD